MDGEVFSAHERSFRRFVKSSAAAILARIETKTSRFEGALKAASVVTMWSPHQFVEGFTSSLAGK
jgi:hypothetical protein